MTAFQLDTSGYVDVSTLGNFKLPGRLHFQSTVSWSDLSPFTQGYIEAAWSAVIELRRDAEDRVQMNLEDLAFLHLAPETLARIIADCGAMVRLGLVDTQERGRSAWRERHAGEWVTFEPLTVQLGDDGKVRFS